MKTLKEFEAIEDIDLRDYLPEPCQIDEELFYHIACGYVASSYIGNNVHQSGEAEDKNEHDVYTYMTVSYVNEKHFYLGILPGFKTEEE